MSARCVSSFSSRLSELFFTEQQLVYSESDCQTQFYFSSSVSLTYEQMFCYCLIRFKRNIITARTCSTHSTALCEWRSDDVDSPSGSVNKSRCVLHVAAEVLNETSFYCCNHSHINVPTEFNHAPVVKSSYC